MLSRIVLSVVVAVVVTLACLLVGGILETLGVAVATTIGAFLRGYSSVIGVLAGLWYMFAGYTWPVR